MIGNIFFLLDRLITLDAIDYARARYLFDINIYVTREDTRVPFLCCDTSDIPGLRG